ncbi:MULTISPECIES: hypothetical protein [unclassified Variovorax]|uniref:hypothetical protein n=1 Tax=unclassified Variovorax TaxID=663243 RepID=UPI003F46069F
MQPFDLDALCRSAQAAVAARIEFVYRSASRAIVDDFRTSRSRCGLPPLVLRTDLAVALPSFYRCPECGGGIEAQVNDWTPFDGRPTEGGVHVYCRTDAQASLLQLALTKVPEVSRYAEYLPEVESHFYSAWYGWDGIIYRAQAWVRANVRVAR